MVIRGTYLRSLVITMVSILLCYRSGSAQTKPVEGRAQLFQDYFDKLATQPHSTERRESAENFVQLAEMIPKMTAPELQQVVSIIDNAINRARISHDGYARITAGQLLWYISRAGDGPALLAPEISHLSALCSDPFTLSGSLYMFMNLPMQTRYPELSVTAMLQAIRAPDANSPNGKGPAYAVLLSTYPGDGDLMKDVLVYMQRPDLNGQKLVEFLSGFVSGNSSTVHDAISEQLIQYLNDPQPEIRLLALRDLGLCCAADRERLEPTFRRLAHDPYQSDELRALAVQFLEPNKIFSLDPYSSGIVAR